MSKKSCGFILLGLLLTGFAGCKNPEGRFRPPDPLGYAIFEMLDRGPHRPPPQSADAIYAGEETGPNRPSPNSVWVDGTWGTSNGRRVWIPAHWQ